MEEGEKKKNGEGRGKSGNQLLIDINFQKQNSLQKFFYNEVKSNLKQQHKFTYKKKKKFELNT